MESKFKNLINIESEELPKYIYKIIPLEHLILMLSNRQLVLAKTSSWEDVYENFFIKQEFEQNGGRIEMAHLCETTFGQCWSLNSSSDALWRIYSHDKRSVRIRTTIQKLYNAVCIDKGCLATTYIGKVDYLYQTGLNRWVKQNSPISIRTIDKLMIESMFLKRKSFSHEKEVRVIYRPDMKSPDGRNKLNYYRIDPIDFIEQIMFDPRADDAYVNGVKDVISKYGFPSKKVRKSELYNFKPKKVQLT